MAFNPLASLFGWTSARGRTLAAYKVTTVGGDSPPDSTIQSDLAGVAWAQGAVEVPCEDAVLLTVGGADVAAGRQFVANVTVAGVVVFKLLKGSSMTLTFPVGITTLNYAVLSVTSNAGTGTFYSLK